MGNLPGEVANKVLPAYYPGMNELNVDILSYML